MMAKKRRVLVVDDDEAKRYITAKIIKKEYDVAVTATKAETLECIKTTYFDVVVLDLLMPDVNGFELLDQIKKERPKLDVIVYTSLVDVTKGVESIKRGAYDYIVREWDDQNITHRLALYFKQKEIDQQRQGFQNESLVSNETCYFPKHKIYEDILQRSQKAFENGLNLLVLGETGTGKGMLVKHLRQKIYPEKYIISVNASAIPESLAESELFGHQKNSFNDAQERKGKFELANHGIIFLDEIGNMSLPIQEKILKTLEDKTVVRLGGSCEIPIDFQLVAATNQDLPKAINTNKFREDLYYRIKDVEVCMPSLATHPELVQPYITYFVEKYNTAFKRNINLPDSFINRLYENLNGNIRGLAKEIQVYIALNGDINPSINPGSHQFNIDNELDRIHKMYINNRLAANNKNKSKTAEDLGINRTTLIGRMKKFGVEINDLE